jgi:hypothetical protein
VFIHIYIYKYYTIFKKTRGNTEYLEKKIRRRWISFPSSGGHTTRQPPIWYPLARASANQIAAHRLRLIRTGLNTLPSPPLPSPLLQEHTGRLHCQPLITSCCCNVGARHALCRRLRSPQPSPPCRVRPRSRVAAAPGAQVARCRPARLGPPAPSVAPPPRYPAQFPGTSQETDAPPAARRCLRVSFQPPICRSLFSKDSLIRSSLCLSQSQQGGQACRLRWQVPCARHRLLLLHVVRFKTSSVASFSFSTRLKIAAWPSDLPGTSWTSYSTSSTRRYTITSPTHSKSFSLTSLCLSYRVTDHLPSKICTACCSFVSAIHLFVGTIYCLGGWAVGFPKRAVISFLYNLPYYQAYFSCFSFYILYI